jgi:predicted nuclease of restriction endonuclease-like RecB superfamily
LRFSLQDIKKQVQRRGDTLSVSLHFLRPGELRGEIERLVTYHEQLLGRPQRDFSIEDARACIGDYRLAHCLISTLNAWYSWRQCAWQTALQRSANDLLIVRFQEAGIISPVQLRLALFNFVNERYCGFLDVQTRTEALEQFAEMYCEKDDRGVHTLSVADLEYLLALDSDEEALLVRDDPHPPGADQVAALYNQWVFEAALFNASDVHFVIDCSAFMEMQDVGANIPSTGVGAVIKRLCYLARKLGVYYDLAYDSASIAGQTTPSILHLTLYGPQEMTGAPQQYGIRLAKLSRILLGYSIPNHPRNNPRMGGGGDDEGRGRLRRPALDTDSDRLRRPGPASPHTLPTTAILKAEATVHFLQRSYRFVMDTNLLNLLPPPSDTNLIETQPSLTTSSSSSNEQTPNQQLRESSHPYHITSAIYDSSIEQSFAEAFQSLANSDAADGWRLEREPEPLLLTYPLTETTSSTPPQGIFIPDFALTRDNLRIYVEILGFWTPSYRERKFAKLQLLKGRNDLVLAIPRESYETFASLSTVFPIVIYDGQLSATELLKVLRSHYDDLAERLAHIDVDSIRKRIESEGLLPERACYTLLHCYRRSELQQAAEHVISEGIAFTPGVGFYQTDWLEQLRSSFVEWLREVGGKSLGDSLREEGRRPGEVEGKSTRNPLPWVIQESRSHWPILAACEDATIEALISLWPEVHISRSSIFEATVAVLEGEEIQLPQVETTPKKSTRERRTPTKKRIIRETSQPDLWN